MNLIVVTGNLTRDPELRYTQSGTAVAQFGLANNEGFGDKKQVTFLDVVVWGGKDKPGQAGAVADNLKKGAKVLVRGRLQKREWDDKEGNKRTTVEIVAESYGGVEFLDGKKAEKAQSQAREVDPDEIPF